jgi:23S rRNA (guanine745-N1)-methyltransferase
MSPAAEAARRGGARYFVANLAHVPVADESFDFASLLFAPFQEAELARVLKPSGRLFLVVPGKRHLFGLKQAVYDAPYENDEALPETKRLKLIGTERIDAQICLGSQADIQAVFRMTPYYYRTAQADREKLNGLDELETEISFVIAEYQKVEAEL